MMTAVIVAGGKGGRLGLPWGIPKPLAPLGAGTFLSYTVEQAAAAGLVTFVFMLGHQGEAIEAYVREKLAWTLPHAKFSYDPEEGCGKGKALSHALRNGTIDRSQPILILHPDDLFKTNIIPALVERYNTSGKHAALAVASDRRIAYGTVLAEAEGLCLHFEEKPPLPFKVSTGLAVLGPEALDIVELNICPTCPRPAEYEAEIYPLLAAEGELALYDVPDDTWYPINEPWQYSQAEKVFI